MISFTIKLHIGPGKVYKLIVQENTTILIGDITPRKNVPIPEKFILKSKIENGGRVGDF